MDIPNLTAACADLKKSNDLAKLKETIQECLRDVALMEIEFSPYGKLHYYQSDYGEWVRAGDLQEAARIMAEVIASEFL